MRHVHSSASSRKPSAPAPHRYSATTWVERCLFLADEALGHGSPAGAKVPLRQALYFARSLPARIRAPYLRQVLALWVWKAEMENELGAKALPADGARDLEEHFLERMSLYVKAAEDALRQPRRYNRDDVQELLREAAQAKGHIVGDLRCDERFFVLCARLASAQGACREMDAIVNNVVRVDFGAGRKAA